MKKRYLKIDIIRAVAIINMIAYHTVWDLVYLYDFDWKWYMSEWAYIWQQFICWSFILVSGFSVSLGSKKIRRGLVVLLSGEIISVVTTAFMAETRIQFGILTCVGSCMLMVGISDKMMKKLNPVSGIIIGAGLFVVTRNINEGFLGFEKWNLIELPEKLYCNTFSTYLGFTVDGFFSTDYFSIFPWIFLYITGYYLYKLFEAKDILKYFEKGGSKWLEWIGRHSLEFYIVHQPLIYLALMLIFKE